MYLLVVVEVFSFYVLIFIENVKDKIPGTKLINLLLMVTRNQMNDMNN